jgi:predicted TIM-barrel enzyme
MADAVVVTGEATGRPVNLELLARVRSASEGRPVVIGSGLSPDNAAQLLPLVEAAIVGTWVKVDGQVRNPVDLDRVRTLVEACRLAG